MNGGYGDGTAPGAERAAVVEAWGEYIGTVYADRQYGLNHSNTLSTNPVTIEQTRHIYNNEAFAPILPPNNDDEWLPWDLFNDCVDDNPTHTGPNDGVIDDVTGYTTLDCFNAVIAGNPTLMNQVENNLIQNLPTGETVNDVNALFVEYGY